MQTSQRPTQPRPNRPRRAFRYFLLGFALFTAAGVLFGLQFYLSNTQLGGTSPASAFIYDQIFYWYTWGMLFPIVLWLSRRLPLPPEGRPRSLLFHGLAGVAVGYLHAIVYIGLYHLFSHVVQGVPFSSESAVQGFFRLNLPMRILNYYLITAGIVAVDFYQKYVDRAVAASRLESELAVAKVQMLRMQMHPHFLFNTLNSIAGLVRAGERPQAVRMIAGLSDLLRAALDGENGQFVTLGREVEFVRRYLEIEQVRFSDRLTVAIDVDAAAAQVPVPNLLLQPLVENAVNHGIAMRPGAGRIDVTARRTNGRLEIEVSDDGVGLPDGWELDRDAGIGLRNTRDRLRHLYGEGQRFELRRGLHGGVMVSVAIAIDDESAGGGR